jgi:ubiquitin carboxyl-terminal hydrolase 4/11
MFEIGFFAGSKEMIPSGWNVVDEDKVYPSISSRNPQVYQPIDEDSGNGFEDGRAGSESSEEGLYPSNGTSNGFSSTTRMVEETSDEEEDIIPPVIPRVSEHSPRISLQLQYPYLPLHET